MCSKLRNTLEETVKITFKSKGFNIVMYKDYIKDPEEYGNEILIKNVPFTSIYNHSASIEFLLKSKKHKLEIGIECKWQRVSGSVDEKLPYLYLNCLEAMPEDEIIIIIDGDGFKEGAINWLKSAVDNNLYTSSHKDKKTIKIMSMVEFVAWANSKFK